MTEMESLLILMVVIWVAGKIFRFLSLPVLFGELLGGLLVGPVVFGVIPADSEVIEILAEFGIFFLMLHTGLETDPRQLFKSFRKSLAIALGAIGISFLAAFLISLSFGFPYHQALFLAIGLSASAIAISIRVFKDMGKQDSRVAQTVLGAAVSSEIIVLILFSIVLRVIEDGSVTVMDVSWVLARVVGFFAIVILAGMKLQKYTTKIFRDKGFTLTLIIALFLGLLAEKIGMHMIIGAFLAGLFIHAEILDDKIYNKIEDRVFGLSYSFLGPVFFATLAFHLDFAVFEEKPWLFIALFLSTFIGKTLGAGIVARALRFKKEKALTIGLAMTSQGVVDLVIASIGLQLGIINEEIFSLILAVAFLATFVSIFSLKPLAKHI